MHDLYRAMVFLLAPHLANGTSRLLVTSRLLQVVVDQSSHGSATETDVSWASFAEHSGLRSGSSYRLTSKNDCVVESNVLTPYLLVCTYAECGFPVCCPENCGRSRVTMVPLLILPGGSGYATTQDSLAVRARGLRANYENGPWGFNAG